MTLSELKLKLKPLEIITFKLPNGSLVPNYFHVTEVGKISKHFIDCGGKERKEDVINFQLWEANDYDHRLHPEKLLHIIELSERILNLDDIEIEVEYQSDTIGKYSLDFDGEHFLLKSTNTACLALDYCGIPQQTLEAKNTEHAKLSSGCKPNSGCC